VERRCDTMHHFIPHMSQVSASVTPFVSVVAPSRASAFTGTKISSKSLRSASRKSAVAAQAKVSHKAFPRSRSKPALSRAVSLGFAKLPSFAAARITFMMILLVFLLGTFVCKI
jgi:hypothetical protein